MSAPRTAVILVSGGLDSCVAAAAAERDHDLAFLHISYGQRTERRERAAFEHIAEHYSVEKRLVVDLQHLRQIGGSSLVDGNQPIPPADAGSAVPSTYVPFRNANLLAVAVSWAEALGGAEVFIGTHELDAPYPDCSADFLAAFRRSVETGTRPGSQIGISAPLLHLDKVGIVRLGLELRAPLHRTWSCYHNEIEPCGSCDSCNLRRRGFAGAGAQDPLLSHHIGSTSQPEESRPRC